ncbi:hypothetical protein GCM10027074_11530 [Streptomyces deserti]
MPDSFWPDGETDQLSGAGQADSAGELAGPAWPFGSSGKGSTARVPRPGEQLPPRSARSGQYASTTLTSSSVTSPATIRKERNWNSPAPSVSAVDTRT